MAEQTRRRPGIIAVLPLFLLSGGCGLVYEVIWVRKFTQFLGGTVASVTAVLTAYMAGLALGSYLYGRWVDKSRRPLHIYALLELGIAASGLAVTFAVDAMAPVFSATYRTFADSGAALNLARFLLSLIMMLIPTTLMGATFPVMSRFVVRERALLPARLGLIYAINTLGAAGGCLAAGFALIPRFGLYSTTIAAAAMNALIGLLALVLSAKRYHQGAGGVDVEPVAAPTDQHQPLPDQTEAALRNRTMLAYAISGLTALGFEIVWTRLLAMILGSSTYAFTTMLASFLIGIGLGGYAGGRIRGTNVKLRKIFAGFQAAIAGLTLFTTASLGFMPVLFLKLFPHFGYGESFTGVVGLHFMLAMILMIIPSLLFGAAMPLAGTLVTDNVARVGRRIGSAYAANTLGSIIGSAGVGLMLIPLIGLRDTSILLACLNLLGAVILRPTLDRLRDKAVAIALGLAAAAGIVSNVWIAWNPTLLARGVYDARRYVDKQGRLFIDRELQGRELVFYREGRGSTVAVYQSSDGDRALYIDGKPVAGGSFIDVKHLKMLGHLPMLLHGTARNVLVIGFGMGVTTGACALYPEAQVTCVELTPEVLEAGPYFERQNHGAVHHPRVSLVVADGRTYVDAIPGSYDVITSDPIHPWVSGSSGLYSADHYKVCRNRLNPGGVFCQWLPLYQLAPEDVAIVVRSFLEAFPDGSLWATEFDGLLIGATDNINIDTVQLNALLDKRRIFDDLDEIGLADPFAICGLLIAGPRQLDPWAASAPLNTENHPIIEFNVPRSAYKITHISNLAMLHALRSDPADRFRDTSITVTGLSNTERELIDWVRGADLQRDGLIALGHHKYNDAEALLRAALAVQPASRETKIKLAEVCFAKGSWMAAHQNPSGARLLYEHGLGLDPTRAQAWNFLGSLRYESGDFPGAEAAWRQALAANPSYVPAAVNLEGFLRAMRQPS